MKLSIIDVSPVGPGLDRHETLMQSIALAQLAEKWNYSRYWVAEHHGAASVAGRAPEILIGAIAAHTRTIPVGSGSVLLNHYSPLKVAEVFCTLNELYPGRIELGAGRATTGQILDYALQQDRSKKFYGDSNQQIAELVAWLDNSFPGKHPFSEAPIHTLASRPPLYLLGSSGWSAAAAAALGLRYVFAGFINQQGALEMIHTYREHFKPSKEKSGVSDPEAILSLHAVCAETEEEARRQLAPVQLMYRYLAMGNLSAPLKNPDAAIKELGGMPSLEIYRPGSGIPPKFIGGSRQMVLDQLENIARDFQLEEIMIQDLITDFEARKRSYKLLSEANK